MPYTEKNYYFGWQKGDYYLLSKRPGRAGAIQGIKKAGTKKRPGLLFGNAIMGPDMLLPARFPADGGIFL